MQKPRRFRRAVNSLAWLITLTVNALPNQSFAVTRNWIGAGAGGVGTDFNDASNWNPAGTPTSADDIVILLTTSATIQLSAPAETNGLVFQSLVSGQTAILDVNGYELTVNGAATIEGNPGTARIGENGTGAGRLLFKQAFTISSSNSGDAALVGSETSEVVFYGDANINISQHIDWNTQHSNVVFDASGTQRISWNANQNIHFRNVTIGRDNNPTLQLDGNPFGSINSISGNLSVNGSAVLDLNNRHWNSANSSASISLNDNAQLIVTKTDGGMGASNLPNGFGNYNFAKTSTVTYSGGQVQELPGSAAYGNLVINSNTQAHWNANNIRVAGDMTITPGHTFDLQRKHLFLEGNWINNGVLVPNEGSVTLMGSENQDIGGSAVTTFTFLIVDKPNGEATLSNDTNINEKLTLTDGLVTTGNYRVRVGNQNHLGSIEGGSSDSYINGRLERGIVNWSNPQIGLGSEQFYPVGKGGNYRPVYLNFSAMNDRSWASVEHFDSGFQGTAPPDQQTPSAYWDVDISGPTTYNYTVRLDGTGTIVGTDPKILRYDPIAANTDAYDTSFNSPFYSSNNVAMDGHFAISGSNDTMPVTLVSFKAKKSEGAVNLSWETSSELNFDYFSIERSTNPLAGFTEIGTIASGPSPKGRRYLFTDSQLPSATAVYYRLKMNDLDRSFAYSQIESIMLQQRQAGFVYPNPVADKFQLNVDNPAEIISISIYDLSGRSYYTKEKMSSMEAIPVSNFKNGLYFARLTRQNGQHELLKFVVAR